MKVVHIDKILRNVLILIVIVLVVSFVLKNVVKKCPETCDDNNPCTWDVCNKKKECEHKALDGSNEGCTGVISKCLEKGCKEGICTELTVPNCCGNNICEKVTEDVKNCPDDCVIKLTNHFSDKESTYWDTKGYGVLFNPVVIEHPQHSCGIKFKTSKGNVDIKLNDKTYKDISTDDGWNEYMFSCLLLNEEKNDVSITSKDNIRVYFEITNLDDEGSNKYSADGIKWDDYFGDMAIELVEYR